jgi:hypothetical protein
LSKIQSTIAWTFASSDLSVSLCDWAGLYMCNGWDVGMKLANKHLILQSIKWKILSSVQTIFQTKWNLIKKT